MQSEIEAEPSGVRSAAERLAEYRRRTFDVILLVMLPSTLLPMAVAAPTHWRQGGRSILILGALGILLQVSLLALRHRWPFRLRVLLFIGFGQAIFAFQLPQGVMAPALVLAAETAAVAALLLGQRAGVLCVLFIVGLLVAAQLTPPELLSSLALGPVGVQTPYVMVALGILPIFATVAGITIVVRGLQLGFDESLSFLRVLDASEKTFRGVFEASPDAIALVREADGRFIDVNPRFELLSGWRKWEVVGHGAKELGLVRTSDVDAIVARLDAEGKVDGVELPTWRRDGASVTAQVSIRRAEIGGEWVQVYILRDVTIQHRLEAAVRHAQRVETMGALAGGVAHNFRNALGTILPNLDSCLELAPPELREQLRDARNAASSAVDLATRLTQMAHHAPTAPGTLVELRGLLSDVVRLCRSTFGARIRITEALDTDGSVLADRSELHQAFLNLCLNARDAVANAAEPRLWVTLAHSGDGARLIVTVADNGQGMDPETLQRVGEPFFTTKPAGQGTGLGLSTAFASVRAAGGRIAVTSQPGQGTTFTVELPLHADDAAPALRRASMPPLRQDVRVMVVDDDPLLLEAVCRQLSSLGLRPEPFTEPLAALDRIHHGPRDFDVVITDLDMPVITGAALAERIRAEAPSLPIMYLSATPASGSAPDAVKVVLSKPASTADLAMGIARCLGLGAADAA